MGDHIHQRRVYMLTLSLTENLERVDPTHELLKGVPEPVKKQYRKRRGRLKESFFSTLTLVIGQRGQR